MSRKSKSLGLIAILAAGALIGVPILRQRVEAGKREREAHFVTVHYLCVNALATDAPGDLDELITPYTGPDSGLLDPFADGLLYESDGTSFRLEEPKARRVSLFRSDRLISTRRDWPRWQVSGEPARKFPSQEVPPAGYR